jgi:hypothetical protein
VAGAHVLSPAQDHLLSEEDISLAYASSKIADAYFSGPNDEIGGMDVTGWLLSQFLLTFDPFAFLTLALLVPHIYLS